MRKTIGLILALALPGGCSVAAGNDKDYTRGNTTVAEAVESLEREAKTD